MLIVRYMQSELIFKYFQLYCRYFFILYLSIIQFRLLHMYQTPNISRLNVSVSQAIRGNYSKFFPLSLLSKVQEPKPNCDTPPGQRATRPQSHQADLQPARSTLFLALRAGELRAGESRGDMKQPG